MVDPRLDITKEDLQEQEDFINSVNDKVTEAHEAIIAMRKLKKQMSSMTKVHDIEVINDKVTAIDSSLTAIEKALYQTQNKSGQDPLNFPIRLTNKLAHLNSLVQIGDARPTAAMYEVRDELSQRIDAELTKYNKIKVEDIKELNQLIKSEVEEFIKP